MESTSMLVDVITCLAILLVIGVISSRRMKGIKLDFEAGKDLILGSVAFSTRATGESRWLLIGLVGAELDEAAR